MYGGSVFENMGRSSFSSLEIPQISLNSELKNLETFYG